MASDRQIQANRSNAKASTGPKSSAGKAASSMNALKHGLRAGTRLIGGEDPAHYAALQDGVYEEFGPQNAYQKALADEVVDYLWWCSRCKRVEAGLLTSDLSDQIGVIQPLMQLIKYLHEGFETAFNQVSRRF